MLSLTAAGRAYAGSVRQALTLIDEATRTLRHEPWHLTLSVTPTFASRWILPRLPDFTAAHPDIDLRVMASERLAQFYQDGVDLAVRFGQPPFGPGLNTTLLFPLTLTAVTTPLLRQKLGDPQQKANLVHYTLLHDGHNMWPRFLSCCFPTGAPVIPFNLRFNQTALALDAAINGQGIALTSRHFVQNELAAGRLTEPFCQTLPTDAGWYLVSPRRPRQHAPSEQIRTWLMQEADKLNEFFAMHILTDAALYRERSFPKGGL